MNELQKKLVDMLGWFHNFCVDNNLRYYALEGTCLGMVRHKGIIPWDDDVDVGMPRTDYNRFISLMKDGFDGYTIGIPLEDKNYLYTYAKLYDSKTTLVENTRKKLKRGVFIDIFPLDGAGDDLEEGKKQFNRINRKIKCICLKNCVISKQRTFYKNVAILFSQPLPGFILNVNKLIKNVISDSSRHDFDKCTYVANFSGDWGTKEIFKREWFGEPILYDFEDIRIYGPADAHNYLTNLYGDYMTPPPLNKRVTRHDYLYLNLEEGYI